MLAPSKETLQRIAGETGYQPGTIEKVLRLLDILQEISRDAGLRGQFALKGGTALNVFHLVLAPVVTGATSRWTQLRATHKRFVKN